MRPKVIICGAVLATAIPIAARATTVEQILISPSHYDGQHVDVVGVVSDLRSTVSHRGNEYVTFRLCAGRCIHVFAFGAPPISDGQSVTVHGVFATVRHVREYTFYDEIEADDGSL